MLGLDTLRILVLRVDEFITHTYVDINRKGDKERCSENYVIIREMYIHLGPVVFLPKFYTYASF